MSDFTIVVVGCGGGPSENDLSSYFVKCAGSKWRDGILALEAGSGLGALTRIIANDPHLFHDDDNSTLENVACQESQFAPEVASRVYSSIRSFIVTHGHLDHVMSLVMAAGSQGGPTRYILGLEHTIEVLESMFNGHIWPKLAARQREVAPEFFYRYLPVHPSDLYVPVAPGIAAHVMPVSHGTCAQSADGTYESSAWFIRNDATSREFLFFGDVEPDSLSVTPRTRAVWKAAAKKIHKGVLNTIFLECSWRTSRSAEELYGHLSPPHVLEELRNLASELVTIDARPPPTPRLSFLWRMLGYESSQLPVTLPDNELKGSLKGIRLVVIHCKASTEQFPSGQSIADVISAEIRALVDAAGLGITVEAAKQGMTIHV